MHRRLRPRPHRFRYGAFWCLLDLDELPQLCRHSRLFAYNQRGLFSLQDRDHGDGSARPLRAQAEQRLAEAGVVIPDGKIRLLCMPRTLGHCFNPLSVYFCHDRDGKIAALIYEVHNTFGERHSYVLPVKPHDETHQDCDKRFYVSPFLGMDMHYDFRLAGPGDHISIAISASEAGSPVLNAVLKGRRLPFSDRTLLRLAALMPAITFKVILAIHWEALKLWLKGLRLHARVPAPGIAPSSKPY